MLGRFHGALLWDGFAIRFTPVPSLSQRPFFTTAIDRGLLTNINY
jgi:hypothetical protein